ALEAPKEPKRPKTHWDHVLEEMLWLSKVTKHIFTLHFWSHSFGFLELFMLMIIALQDFESERKWKLAQAKKVAMRASKGMLDQATRGEKRVKVAYKHQLELDEKKKKALDKQLEFLLGQTERYSTMLAENLVNSPTPCKPSHICTAQEKPNIPPRGDDIDKTKSESDAGSQSNSPTLDEDYDVLSEDELVDDEHTIEEDEALITNEEREEELAALQSEIDLPLEEILKRYAAQEACREKSPEKINNAAGATDTSNLNSKDGMECDTAIERTGSPARHGCRSVKSNGILSLTKNHYSEVETYKRRNSLKKLHESEKKLLLQNFKDEHEDDDFVLSSGEEKETDMDDETTLLEEEELANAESGSTVDEIALLQKESEVPVEELIARYKKGCDSDGDAGVDSDGDAGVDSDGDVGVDSDEDVGIDSQSLHASGSEEFPDLSANGGSVLKQPGDESTGLELEIYPRLQDDEAELLGKSGEDIQSENIIADAAAAARSAQPTGNTFSTTKVRTKFPFLIKYPLREYQHIGLDWLVTMYEKRLNGILADEMGLGKTIMTIALLAHLASFKILTYFGSAKERRIKRQGWMKPNYFHVCITTYRLVIQDSKVFKRKKWKYLILDEAHLIKNWKSQRWQTLLNFNSKRRILLTGTPLQNDLMELWSLMHFLMPHVFQSHQEFKDWFSNPISGMVDGQEKVNKEVVDRLHNVLRPFILRRLKRDVEKQLPMKHEHVVSCRLSRRQRNLYEDFIASSETQATLSSANFFGMISIIMQLRKVCNHPDLFEGRPIVSSYDMSGIDMQLSSSVCSMLVPRPLSHVDLRGLGFVFTHLDFVMTSWEGDEIQAIATPSSLIARRANMFEGTPSLANHKKKLNATNIFVEIQKALLNERLRELNERAAAVAWWNALSCKKKPIYATDLRELVTVKHPVHDIHSQKYNPLSYLYSSRVADIVLSPAERFTKMVDQIESFMFAIPAARAPSPVCWCTSGGSPVFIDQSYKDKCSEALFPLLTPFRPAIVRRQVYFPDRRLIQFDCGKLQELAVLLRKLKSEGHRALIFTQMTKMLDILEAFINLYGYTYMRLDGSTPPEERQTLMQRFNTNTKIFLFILSTRSGGVGINLVGADTVIFYDSDWNPAMDQQAQDRCHRIGQTREVHIYRLISECTIEENILKKANQKRALDNLVIQSGSYNTEFFKKLDPMELFSGHRTIPLEDAQTDKTVNNGGEINLSSVDLEAALKNAEDEADYMALKKVEEEEAVDNQEFTEEAIGRLEDDELVNEEDIKPDDTTERGVFNPKSDEGFISRSHPFEETPRVLTGEEEDVDMLGDVKQMAAAAAAAGQAILSFEDQLRPIDRYAVRFLELWDPIIDKAAVESHVQIEETEWELDRIEKLKDDMEAEIDDDEEPLVYERWDTDFATEVYRQQVEALAHHQLMEDLEREAKEKEALEYRMSDSFRNEVSPAPKSKSKKKNKKTKFKSLKKGALVSKPVSVKAESSTEPMSLDDDLTYDELLTSSDALSPSSTREKKRKPALDDDEQMSKKKTKKEDIFLYSKSSSKYHNNHKHLKFFDNGGVDLETKQLSRGKTRGKLSISVMPLKRVFTIKPEKLKKKGNIWSKDFPTPDPWSTREDAVLCAVVHEYGPNWNLACEILYGMTAGGYYRGRFRHPVHCCERFRELIQRYVLSVGDATNTDKAVSVGSGKALLRVTEDNIWVLLSIASELPDDEPLQQKHYFAALSAAWRISRPSLQKRSLSTQNGFYSSPQFGTMDNHQNSPRKSSEMLEFRNLYQCGVLVAAALNGDCSHQTVEGSSIVNQNNELLITKERLDITLAIEGERDEITPLPSTVDLSILGPDPPPSTKMHASESSNFKSSWSLVENQFRNPGPQCVEGSLGEEFVGFPIDDTRSWTPQVQHLGRHKIIISESLKPNKLKLKRTSIESNGLQCLTASQVFQTLPLTVSDSSTNSDELPSCFDEVVGLECDNKYLHGTDNEIASLDGTLADAKSEVTPGHRVALFYRNGSISLWRCSRRSMPMKVFVTRGWGGLCCAVGEYNGRNGLFDVDLRLFVPTS
ncbi:protein PHOTOPERIOD-INDEPENDENT EARLY FLOWERING 1, partial [Dorcoceras hygrometricum]